MGGEHNPLGALGKASRILTLLISFAMNGNMSRMMLIDLKTQWFDSG